MAPWALERRRHSLYHGELGLAVLLTDLSCPEESCMPFFEPQGWYQEVEHLPGSHVPAGARPP
jgi:eukaryotic-like serine/threonine-protein kinase